MHSQEQAPTKAKMALRNAIQRRAVGHRFYGYRRIAVLVQREGYEIGTQKVRRLMKQDNLLSARRRKFVTTTEQRPRLVMDARCSCCAPLLEAGRRNIAQRRVPPFRIIDSFQEFSDPGVGFLEMAVFVAVNLLLFESLHEGFAGCLGLRVSLATHADREAV